MSNSKHVKWSNLLSILLILCVMSICLFTKGNTVYALSTGKVTAISLNVRSKASATSASTDTSSSSSTFLKRYGYVKATSLNVRSSPSVSAPIVTKLPNKKYVLVLGQTAKSGTVWYKISAQVNGKTVKGYVSKEYIVLYATTTDKTAYNLATVNNSTLTAYKTANTYDTKRAALKLSQQVIVLGNLTVKGIPWSYIYAVVNGKGISGYVKASYLTKVTATIGNKESKTAVTTKTASAKKIAATMASNVEKLKKGTTVKIRGALTVLGKKWYKCDFYISGAIHTGYILTSCVEIPDDAAFLEELSKFPASYQNPIKELHEKYPKWHFARIHTELDWNTVIENESKIGRNVIQSNQPKGGSAGTYSAPFSYLSTEAGAYDWATDKFKVYDGSNWYCANSSVIAHYMDPRNALTKEGIWQFESLAYDSRQKKEVVQSILSNTFMKSSYSVKDKTTGKIVSDEYKDTFMEAGHINGVSPYFLAIRAKQELGLNGSGSVSGTYPGYTGYYNYFNIGAFDSSSGQAIANGLKYARSGTTYQRPWTNPYKAIVGGAGYIAAGYIKRGQNTLYTQKFNVVSSPFYSHQYMSNVQAPASESKSTHNSYFNMGIAEDTFVFYIPVYKNMPSSPCKLPASKGNPNSYLKNITIKHGTVTLPLTPTFDYRTKTYTMAVDHSVSQVKISAAPISTYAQVIDGTGTVNLPAGKTTTVSVVCKAGNGSKTTYTVKISRKA
ncbi:SH3 domain-containing protein [[Clostridium] polysaccharolyticum]|uniref:Beta-N-acetylglucosaminidase n=1 Tax=[Clostridium] polysaccharolyticum TaxID=29364 RepID=A0A1I0DL62_9FIRM|nr:SH3 domain-containing protein [[Clostridium] polysaccharolyticum]SET33034.1 Beta-N-acetylglucosaminidase [[Clostridium] polysaccharolyticum]